MLGDINSYTLRLVLASCLGSITYGFCSGVAGSVVAQPAFQEYFNYTSSPSKADAFNGLFSGGGLIGTILGGVISEKYGRRIAIFIGCILAIIGSAIMCGSVDIAMLYVSRVIAGIAVGFLVMLVPLWQTEVSPAKGRGFLVALHSVTLVLGYSMSMWFNYAFYFAKNPSTTWRGPFGLQLIWPSILSVLIWTLPESPRWLLENERYEEAKKGLMTLEGSDFTEEGFQHLIHEMKNENQQSSWSSLFTVKSYRKRLLLGVMVMCGAQGSGTVAITNYGPTIYATLGFNSSEQLYMNSIYITTGVFYNLIAGFLMDKIGRKKMLMTGMIVAGCIAMACESAMIARYAGTDNISGNRAAVFFIFFHICAYGSTTDAATYVYATEIWPTHIRSKGSALSISGLFIGILAFTTGVTTAMENIGWKFYLVFVCCSFATTLGIYFFLPETKNLTLEEIGALFGDNSTENVIDGVEMSSQDSDIEKQNVEMKTKA